MKLTKSEADLAWAAMRKGLITIEDVEKAAEVQQKEYQTGKRQPRSLTVILMAQNRLQAFDVAHLLKDVRSA